jgi:malonyl CoA-acyl carrier protein transacylase/phosphopantetheinyl transferase
MAPQQATLAPPVQSARDWPSEVFLLRAADRAGLQQQVTMLASLLARQPGVRLTDLAWTLNTQLQPGEECLALIAEAVGGLNARLERAAARLADPACRRINDSQGIYYTADPLYPQGRIAFLFPGEGAQYPNMLGELLPHFPESQEHFDRCDRISLLAGQRREPLSRSIFLPADATEEERRCAEAELARLDNAAASALTANWAIHQLLVEIGLRADVVTGHSSGETSALAAAGCIEPDDHLLTELFALGHVLQQEEDAGRMSDTALLAVGAGREKLTALVAQVPGDAFLAMDNCPHQTVVGGTLEAIDALEPLLRAAGVVCERLPFSRPYHTPLFQQYMTPIARMYDAIPFQPARVKIYSCGTGRPMPAEPGDIRRLAASQWTARVEFVEIVRAMYEEDGVRLFVEVGPRGNLTSFVQDILRNRPVLAVAANVYQRSDITQLNHLIGQLAAQHVPLTLDHLYRRRDPRPVELHPSPAVNANGDLRDREAVLMRHFQLMQEFLAVQEDVHRRYFDACGTGVPPAGNGTSLASAAGTAALQASAATDGKGVMIGDVVQFEPGQSLLMRRRIDLAEDLYAGDHTLGGRRASAVDPGLNGLAVMPMALNLEMMAEVAALLVPGKRVIGLERVRLQRWIPLFEEPVTVELSAKVVPADGRFPGATHAVTMQIRDLGNATQPAPFDSPSVEGTVLLGDAYPVPPEAGDFPLTNERPCPIGPNELYGPPRRLFHGPLFEVVSAVHRMGDEGVEGELLTLPHAGLFRSTRQPNLLLDPLLIDGSTHVLGSWHMAQEDQTGRVVFPYELGTVQVFGPPPAEGTRLRCRVAIERSSARQVSHRIDMIGPDGRLWCRLHPAEYWRFYWPPECVAFFRHHRENLVSHEWAAGDCPSFRGHHAQHGRENGTVPLPGEGEEGDSPIFAGAKIGTVPEAKIGTVSVRCFRAEEAADIVQPVIRGAMAHVALSPAEWQQFYKLPGPDERRTQWLFSRIAAKDCIRALWEEKTGERLFPTDIEIAADEHGRPVARHRGGLGQMPNISLAHSGGLSAAMANFDCPVGIDVEQIAPRGPEFEQIAFDQQERELLDRFGEHRDEGIARFWCAKEAVAKALGRGLVEGPQTLVVRGITWTGDGGQASQEDGEPAAQRCARPRPVPGLLPSEHEGDRSVFSDNVSGRSEANWPKNGLVPGLTIHLAAGPRLVSIFPELADCFLLAHTTRDGDFVVATTLAEKEPVQ